VVCHDEAKLAGGLSLETFDAAHFDPGVAGMMVSKLEGGRTGKIIKSEFKRFAFPPRWHYDILRALDYFQAVKAPRDRRLAEAIDIVRASRRPDGRWSLQNYYKGKSHFELERLGTPSRWNTLRALRVLKWWDMRARERQPDRGRLNIIAA
jgi:hypothetical protein